MREEFIIQRNGKDFVLYSGLLDEAHFKGLKSIEAHLVDYSFDEKGNPVYAVAQARVEMEDGRVFEEMGDASASNVGRGIVPHLFRMALTRSKARALRDAVNVGATSLEELGGDDAPEPSQARPSGPRSASGAGGRGLVPVETPPPTQEPEDRDGSPSIGEAQLARVWDLMGKINENANWSKWVQEEYGYPLEMLNAHEGSDLISRLRKRLEKGAAEVGS